MADTATLTATATPPPPPQQQPPPTTPPPTQQQPPSTQDQPQQQPQGDAIDEFIALPHDEQMDTLQQLSEDDQDKLLAQVSSRQRSKQQQQQQPTQQQQQQPGDQDDWDIRNDLRRDVDVGRGALKGAGQTIAGLLEQGAGPLGAATIPLTRILAGPTMEKAAAWLRQHTQINSPEQQAGNIAETVAEVLGLPEMDAEKMALKANSVADVYSQGAKLSKFLTENPKILTAVKIGLNALRGGTEQAGQTYLKSGGDTDETEQAGLLGAGGSLAFEGTAAAIGAGRRALAETALEHMPPPPRSIAGAKLATTPEGRLSVAAGGERAATQQAETAIQNIGQRGLKNSLERANAARPVEPPPTSGVAAMPGEKPLILTDNNGAMNVENARSQLIQDARTLNDPEIGVRQQQAIRDRMEDIQSAVDKYDDYAAKQPHFPPHDVAGSVAQATDLQSAGQLAKEAQTPFFQKADELTDGAFKPAVKKARDLAWSQTATPEEVDAANDAVENLFQEHRTKFSPQEWQTAREGYREGIAMNELGRYINGQFGGITAEDAAERSNLQRIFGPTSNFNSKVDGIYQKYKPELDRTVGRQGMLDIKELGQLFQNPETQEATKGLVQNIGSAIRRHYWGVRGVTATEGLGAALGTHYAGHAIAGALGGAVSAPIAAGTIGGTRRYILDRIASDPTFARRFIYAAKNKVSPRIAAPLLASRILANIAKPTPEEAIKKPETPEGEQ